MDKFYKILDSIDDVGFGVFMAHRKVNKSEALRRDLRCKVRWGAVWLARHNGNTNDYWWLLLKVLVPDYGFDKAMTVLAGYWDSTHTPDKLQKPARWEQKIYQTMTVGERAARLLPRKENNYEGYRNSDRLWIRSEERYQHPALGNRFPRLGLHRRGETPW